MKPSTTTKRDRNNWRTSSRRRIPRGQAGSKIHNGPSSSQQQLGVVIEESNSNANLTTSTTTNSNSSNTSKASSDKNNVNNNNNDIIGNHSPVSSVHDTATTSTDDNNEQLDIFRLIEMDAVAVRNKNYKTNENDKQHHHHQQQQQQQQQKQQQQQQQQQQQKYYDHDKIVDRNNNKNDKIDDEDDEGPIIYTTKRRGSLLLDGDDESLVSHLTCSVMDGIGGGGNNSGSGGTEITTMKTASPPPTMTIKTTTPSNTILSKTKEEEDAAKSSALLIPSLFDIDGIDVITPSRSNRKNANTNNSNNKNNNNTEKIEEDEKINMDNQIKIQNSNNNNTNDKDNNHNFEKANNNNNDNDDSDSTDESGIRPSSTVDEEYVLREFFYNSGSDTRNDSGNEPPPSAFHRTFGGDGSTTNNRDGGDGSTTSGIIRRSTRNNTSRRRNSNESVSSNRSSNRSDGSKSKKKNTLKRHYHGRYNYSSNNSRNSRRNENVLFKEEEEEENGVDDDHITLADMYSLDDSTLTNNTASVFGGNRTVKTYASVSTDDTPRTTNTMSIAPQQQPHSGLNFWNNDNDAKSYSSMNSGAKKRDGGSDGIGNNNNDKNKKEDDRLFSTMARIAGESWMQIRSSVRYAWDFGGDGVQSSSSKKRRSRSGIIKKCDDIGNAIQEQDSSNYNGGNSVKNSNSAGYFSNTDNDTDNEGGDSFVSSVVESIGTVETDFFKILTRRRGKGGDGRRGEEAEEKIEGRGGFGAGGGGGSGDESKGSRSSDGKSRGGGNTHLFNGVKASTLVSSPPIRRLLRLIIRSMIVGFGVFILLDLAAEGMAERQHRAGSGGVGVIGRLRRRPIVSSVVVVPSQYSDRDIDAGDDGNVDIIKTLPEHAGLQLAENIERRLVDIDEDLPPNPSRDLPFFWHIPRSGGATVFEILGICHNLVLASNAGAYGERDQVDYLNVFRVPPEEEGSDADGNILPYIRHVNVDLSTAAGIRSAHDRKLSSAGLAQVIISSLLHDVSNIFALEAGDGGKGGESRPGPRRGRAFMMMRNPVERAVSLYHYWKDNGWMPPVGEGKTLAEFFAIGEIESDWHVRFLTGQPTKGSMDKNDLSLAKEILRRKFLVGLLEKKSESLQRFGWYYGWWGLDSGGDKRKQCAEERLHTSWPMSNSHETLEEGSETWKIISNHNRHDMQLYEYAKELFHEQRKVLEMIPR